MFSKHRVEALSDGIFAIVMTLLIIEIKVPEKGPLAEALRSQAHEWISFAVTFGIASLFWVLQHRLFDLVERLNTGILTLTFLALCLVTVLPFSTSLWGHHIAEPI